MLIQVSQQTLKSGRTLPKVILANTREIAGKTLFFNAITGEQIANGNLLLGDMPSTLPKCYNGIEHMVNPSDQINAINSFVYHLHKVAHVNGRG